MIESLLFPLVPERFKEDERYRKGQINIINALPGRRIMGVHIPDMKELAKQLAKIRPQGEHHTQHRQTNTTRRYCKSTQLDFR